MLSGASNRNSSSEPEDESLSELDDDSDDD